MSSNIPRSKLKGKESKMKFYFITLLLLLSLASYSQTYLNILYDNGNLQDIGEDVLVENDGYAFAALSAGAMGWEMAFWKLDKFGSVIWKKNYPGPESILAPSFNSFHHLADSSFIYVVNPKDSLSQGGFIYLLKLNSLGDTIWTRVISDTVHIFSNQCLPQPDGGFIICGSKMESNQVISYDFLLLKLDSLGNIIWKRQYFNPSGHYNEIGYSALNLPGKGFLIVGESSHWNWDVYLVETDSNGVMLWDTLIGTGAYEGGSAIYPTSDGGFLISGISKPFGNLKSDGMIAKLDSAKIIVWIKNYGEPNKVEGFSLNMVVLSDGSSIQAGQAMDDQGDPVGWIMKVDANGDSLWNRYYDKRGGNNQSYLYDIEATDDKGFVACGFSTHFGFVGGQDAWLLKVDSMGCDAIGCGITNAYVREPVAFEIYPNPTSNMLHFQSTNQRISEVSIFDISGKELVRFAPGGMHFTVPVSGFAEGVYLYRIVGANGEKAMGKWVKE